MVVVYSWCELIQTCFFCSQPERYLCLSMFSKYSPGFPSMKFAEIRAKVQDAEECSKLKKKLDESVAQRRTSEEQTTKKDKRIHELQSLLSNGTTRTFASK